jgi:DHA2 family methylenomycin A resistance protein-like MFS transporter
LTLVIARLAQGAGAALLVPSSLALLRASYPGARARARAVGLWGAIAGVAAASGPVVGGVLVSTISWRAVFLVNLPVGAIALLLARRRLPAGADPTGAGIDPLGQLAGIAALVALTFGLIEAGHVGWGSPGALGPLTLSVPLLVSFIVIERRALQPMLPLRLFRSPTFSGASLVGVAINLGFYGQLFAMSLYFQHVLRLSALETGLALLPEGIFVALCAAISGHLTGRAGPRAPMIAGLLIGSAGLAGLVGAEPHSSYALLLPALVGAGAGIALTMPAATAAVISAAPVDRAGIASGVLNAGRQAGSAVGVALLGTLVGSGASVAGLHAAMVVASCVFLLGACVAAATVGRGQHY